MATLTAGLVYVAYNSVYLSHSIVLDGTLENQLTLFRLSSSPTRKLLYQQSKEDRILYQQSKDRIGVLSSKPPDFFKHLQEEIDHADPVARCTRYGAEYDPALNRRIFWGSLIADESTELLEIASAESKDLYHGIALVEGNRTQNRSPRPFRHLEGKPTLQQMFGAQDIRIKAYINEDLTVKDLNRENFARQRIIEGWKEMGMTENDLGIVSDIDESFTRDFLWALKTCKLPQLDHKFHDCHYKHVKLSAVTQVFEGSPECVTEKRVWFHPDVISGHCLELIGDHKEAPRESTKSPRRAEGYGLNCTWYNTTLDTNHTRHAWNANDFRATCGGSRVRLKTMKKRKWHNRTLSPYTGFHFHNFFANANITRHKYLTYGHPDEEAMKKPLHHLNNDTLMMVRCVKDLPNLQMHHYVPGGLKNSKPFWPIYFQDPDYRARRHRFVKDMVENDEKFMEEYWKKNNMEPIFGSDGLVKEVRNASEPNNHYYFSMGYVGDAPKLQAPQAELQKATETGLDLQDKVLYEATVVEDSDTASVIALASGYKVDTYRRFVGSLRKTGYKGHIILGVAPDIDKDSMDYLDSRNVQYHKLKWVNCTYGANEKESIFQHTHCADPYPDVKIRWSRFPLARDWIKACKTCTGPILLMDARDSFFQRDPFAGVPPVTGLQVFQEHWNMTTNNWLTRWPIKDCKGIIYKDRPMLCSGTTVGTRDAMIKYLEIMYAEMKVWIERPKCRFDINGDDQSIHNHLYYSGQLPFAHSIPFRKGGIVNTIGHPAAKLSKRHYDYYKEVQNLEKSESEKIPYPGYNGRTWIDPSYGIANEDGLLTEEDGSISRVVHQFDRLGFGFEDWYMNQSWGSD